MVSGCSWEVLLIRSVDLVSDVMIIMHTAFPALEGARVILVFDNEHGSIGYDFRRN